MKSSLLLLSSLALLASCNGGAGTTAIGTTAGAGTTPAATPAAATVPDAVIPVDTNATAMRALVDAINNSADSITITEAVHIHDAGDGAGVHELGTITLKCTPSLLDTSGGAYNGQVANHVKTINGDKYIIGAIVTLCVPQKDANFNLLTAGLPELAAFARSGAIDYLVIPGTFKAAKFHYAAQTAGCVIAGPITNFDDLSPIATTCNRNTPFMLTQANFRNGYYLGNGHTFVEQHWADSAAESNAIPNSFNAEELEVFTASFTAVSALANGTILDPSLLIRDMSANTLTYSGTSLDPLELSYKADGVFLYNGVPRFYTKVNESIFGTMVCKKGNCTTDGPIH